MPESRRRPSRRSRWLAAAALGAALIAILLAAGVPARATADPSSDIPGIPLPGPVVTGILGGPVFDVVYWLDLAPGSVIVASLTGSPGTDFDLYLFDSSATTVVSTVGLVARSTGPTSTESLAFGTAAGVRLYLNLHGASDLAGAFTLTVQTAVDGTPPVVAAAIEGDRTRTNTSTVSVALDATDDLSAVTEMAFSVDGTTFGPWQRFASPAPVILPPGDGLRTVWAKVRNGVGLESAPATASVTVDTIPPSVVALDPAPGSTVVGLRPTFAVTFDEPMAPASWANLGLIVQAAGDGSRVPGTYAYDEARRTGTFVPFSALRAGATYVVTIGNVTDVAGNRPAPRGSWTVVPLAPTSLAARAASSVIALGGSSRIDLSLTGAPLPAGVMVEARPASSPTWGALTTLLVRDGRAALSVAPERNTVYRFSYAGGAGIAPAQAEVRVRVRWAAAFVGTAAPGTGRARVGRPVRIVAALRPAIPGASVSFRLFRFDTVRRQWVFAGSRGRNSDAAGRVSLTWTPTSPGAWYWRVAVAATADHAVNVRTIQRWSVSR